MEPTAYAEMYEEEDSHWWFRGRRAVIWALLRRAGLADAPRILDAGCGTGRNLVEFGELGPASGVDPSQEAIELCRRRGLDNVQCAGLEQLPFGDGEFDLVLALDVVEHVEDDVAALRELRRVAAPGGVVLLTVPAYQWMWSQHDIQLRHFRRYTSRVLAERVRDAGLVVSASTYFNTIMLPGAGAVRLASRLAGRYRSSASGGSSAASRRLGKTDLDRTPKALNRLLGLPLLAEARLIAKGVSLPAGVSLAMVCRPAG